MLKKIEVEITEGNYVLTRIIWEEHECLAIWNKKDWKSIKDNSENPEKHTPIALFFPIYINLAIKFLLGLNK